MNIYGVALLAFCFIVGQLTGDYFGDFLGIKANIGGVGFAMILLILLSNFLSKKKLLQSDHTTGIQFWSNMYIPIIVAMAATQNVKLALSSGFLAICAGIIPVALCMMLIPILSKRLKDKSQN